MATSQHTSAIFDAAVATDLVVAKGIGGRNVSNVHYDSETGDMTWYDEDRKAELTSSVMRHVNPHLYAELRDQMKVLYSAISMKLMHVDSVINKTEGMPSSVTLKLDGTIGNPALEMFQCASSLDQEILDKVRQEVRKYLSPEEMNQVEFLFQQGAGPPCCIM